MNRVLSLAGLMMLTALPANAGEVRGSFKNPVFNDVLLYQAKVGHDQIITPRAIFWADDYFHYNTCELLAEREKAVLLKCKYSYDIGFYYLYQLFYVKKKFFDSHDSEWCCSIGECSFEVKNGIIETEDVTNSPYPWANCQKEDRCPDMEIVNWQSRKKDNCYEELKKLGWDKLLPGRPKEQ